MTQNEKMETLGQLIALQEKVRDLHKKMGQGSPIWQYTWDAVNSLGRAIRTLEIHDPEDKPIPHAALTEAAREGAYGPKDEKK